MNMNKKITGFLFGLASLLMAGLANAATVQINPLSLTVDEGVPFQLMIQGVGFPETGGGGFGLTWDPNVIQLVSTDAQIGDNLIANGFDFVADSSVVIGTSGALASLEVVPAIFFGSPVSGDFNIVTLDFQAVMPGFTTTDLGMHAIQTTWQVADLSTPLDVQPGYLGGTVTVSAVPVPAAAWLFGSGLIGMVAVARRRKTQLQLV